MQIALYQGKSWVSKAIRFITRSKYSHAAFLFDAASQKAATSLREEGVKFNRLYFFNFGSVVEAWQGGVNNSTGLSSLHEPGTRVDIFELREPLTESQERVMVMFCADIIGWPYGFLNVLKFVTKRPGKKDGSYFCSEAVFEGFRKSGCDLLNGVEDWEVPPAWLAMATKLKYVRTIQTR